MRYPWKVQGLDHDRWVTYTSHSTIESAWTEYSRLIEDGWSVERLRVVERAS